MLVQSLRHVIGIFIQIYYTTYENLWSLFYFQIYGCQTQINPGQAI